MGRPNITQLRKLVGIANYQFGAGVGSALFNKQARVECSKRTGRIRHIYRGSQLVATLRPTDGYLALTPSGANILLSKIRKPPNIVAVQTDVSGFVKQGGDVFAKHVVRADVNLRSAEEVIVTDEQGVLLGVGKAVLSGPEMLHFKKGVAVNLRRGVQKSANATDG